MELTQEIINETIAQYEVVKEQVSNYSKYNEAFIICCDNGIEFGICGYWWYKYNIKTVKDWIKNKLEGKVYFAECPIHVYSVEEILESLQTRIDILKQYPN